MITVQTLSQRFSRVLRRAVHLSRDTIGLPRQRDGSKIAYSTVVPLNGRRWFRRRRFLKVMMDFTARCNLKCIMCYFSIPGRDQLRHEISLREFESLAPQLLPYVHYLGLSCATEPFMNRDFFKVLPIVKQYQVPFVYYVTNATLLTENAIVETINAQINLVMISLDSARKETFESIRRNADFDKVLANIRRLRDKKVEMRSNLPKLRFNCTMMRSNIEEIEDLVRLVKELGGEEIDFRHAVPYDGLDTSDLSLSGFKELSNRQFDKARALAAQIGLYVADCPENFRLDEDGAAEVINNSENAGLSVAASNLRQICPYPWTMVAIQPDGSVVPCTYWFTHEPMGNVKEMPFEQIWNGEKYQNLRRELLTQKLGSNCRRCPAMAYGDVNREESFEARKT